MNNKTLSKHAAQNRLMIAMQTAFGDATDTLSAKQIAEMDAQMARVEKLFGYEVGSWARSC